MPYLAGVICLLSGYTVYSSLDRAWYLKNTMKPAIIASASWPAVDGLVTGHKIHEIVKGRFSHSPVTHYHAEPQYRYSVNGKQYRHWRISYDNSNFNRGVKKEAAVAALVRFPVGSKVKVYYDPDDASKAVLDTRLRPDFDDDIQDQLTLALVSVVLFFVCGWVVVRFAPEFKSGKDKDKEA